MGVHVGPNSTSLLSIFVGTMLETPFLETVSPWVSTLDKRSTETRGWHWETTFMDPILGRISKRSPEDVPLGIHVGSKCNLGKSAESRVRIKLGLPLGDDLYESNSIKNQKKTSRRCPRGCSSWSRTHLFARYICGNHAWSVLWETVSPWVSSHIGSKLNLGKSVGTRVRMKLGFQLGYDLYGFDSRKNQKKISRRCPRECPRWSQTHLFARYISWNHARSALFGDSVPLGIQVGSKLINLGKCFETSVRIKLGLLLEQELEQN